MSPYLQASVWIYQWNDSKQRVPVVIVIIVLEVTWKFVRTFLHDLFPLPDSAKDDVS